jgi:hypothetical protein
MAVRKRDVFKKTVGGKDVLIIGDKAKFDTYVSGFTAVTGAEATNVTLTRSGTSAKQYPGDASPITRSGGSVTRLKAEAKRTGALPGKSFWLEQTTGTAPNVIRNANQFTLVGRFVDLHAATVTGATGPITLRSPNGRGYEIADATP